jgi:hypothetical protein
MGMLQLAGIVSGGGKALQQGLQETQRYMTYSMLQKERYDLERERQRLTFSHDEGMLSKRAKIEADAADTAHSRQVGRDEAREEFEMRKGRIERDAARTDAATQFERQEKRDAQAQQNVVTNKVLEAGYKQQEEATKAKQDRAKEERARTDERAKMEHQTAREIVTETIRNQRPHAGGGTGDASGKWDDQTKARYKSLVAEIADLKESLYGLVKAPEKEQPALKKRLDALQQEHDALVGRQSTPTERKPIRWPE